MKDKYGGMEVSDVKKLWALEDENWRLKQMVAEQALDIPGTEGGGRKKMVKPAAYREPVGIM